MWVMNAIILVVLCIGQSGTILASEQLAQNVVEEKGEFACLSKEESVLLQSLNKLRTSNGLKPIENSRSLNKVARLHAIDLHDSMPNLGKDQRGIDCNLHTWSNKGEWTPVCYTSDHKYAPLMWKKPKEITKGVYDDAGYENVYWTSADEVSLYRVIQGWKKSKHHIEVILETGKWENSDWQSIGVGIYRNVAVMWVGSMPDPLGPMHTCGSTYYSQMKVAPKIP